MDNRIGKRKNKLTNAPLGFEDTLWAAADKLRGNMDAAEYKHVVLGVLFLKYISDAFMDPRLAASSMTPRPPIERDNKALKGVLPKNYATPGLDKARLGEIIDLIATISFLPSPSGRDKGLGVSANQARTYSVACTNTCSPASS